MARRESRGGRGFTLIELVIVLAILSIIIAILAPMAFNLLTAERATAVENELQEIFRAIVGSPEKGVFGYMGDVEKYPATLLDLVRQPVDPTTNTPLPGWKGPYVQNARVENGVWLDPLGRPYEYFLAPLASGVGNQLAIISRGPDGLSTNGAENPNVAVSDPSPTDPAYAADGKNTDNTIFPRPANPEALNVIVSGDVALNIFNFDANSKVNAFVPACPQLFNVTVASLTRIVDGQNVEAISSLPYAQGLTFDLVQGLYRVAISPQDQKTVSWTETVTVLPATTLTRTLNLTGLDSSGTPQYLLTVKNSYSATDLEISEFDTQLKGAAVGSTNYKETSLPKGQTLVYVVRACAQVYVKEKSKTTVKDQFVMNYGNMTRIVGANAANLIVTNKAEKRLRVVRNGVLLGTVPRGDVHDDEGKKHPHIKTKTFKDLTVGDFIEFRTDKDNALLGSVTLTIAGDNPVTVQ